MDVRTLRVLRAIVHNEIKKIDPLIQETKPGTYTQQCGRVRKVQEELLVLTKSNTVSRVSLFVLSMCDQII